MKRFALGFALAGAMSFLGVTLAAAYEEILVNDGGTVSGKVTFKGTPPPPKLHELSKFPQTSFCGKVDNDGKGNRVQKLVNVNDGLLQDVVVYIKNIARGKPFKLSGVDVKIDHCRFIIQGGPSTWVGVIVDGGEIRVLNDDADPADPKSVDGILHNPHPYGMSYSRPISYFVGRSRVLPTKGQSVTLHVKLRDPRDVFFLQCDQHSYEEAWFYPVENPYYAVVGKDGTFTIDNIPPGEYELYAWHPMMGEAKEQKVKLAPNENVTVNFRFSQEDFKIKGVGPKKD